MDSEYVTVSGNIPHENNLGRENMHADETLTMCINGLIQNNLDLSKITKGQKAQDKVFPQPSASEQDCCWNKESLENSFLREEGNIASNNTCPGWAEGDQEDRHILQNNTTIGADKESRVHQGMGPTSDNTPGLIQRREYAEQQDKKRHGKESVMHELSLLVQKTVRNSSWWERRGLDISIIAFGFICAFAGFLLLASSDAFPFLLGFTLLGVAHTVITVKGSHLASHNALTESKCWSKFWIVFFLEVCSAFTAEKGAHAHVKLHHAHTNIIGLGDSSTWKLPFLNRYVYMFIAPLAVPVITPLVALSLLWDVPLKVALRTIFLISLGLWANYWLLINISGFQSVWSAILCMFLSRALLSIPYVHVNIFQHIGLAMFLPEKRPKRMQQMSYGVLNLPRNPILDWSFGHSLINCHVEHHLFPNLSDQLCLKVKPVVSKYLTEQHLPYNEDTYLSRLKMFIRQYEELMVHAPAITDLVGIQ
ncbi:fatty acid desaturase 6 [Protopterus annectens]|uniref:fatty acid desaturase 6 n=1 Tax=Protopterus annectens TaxID=7888 RepID=UPI001CF93DFA|nr:fatty acid desaturase 6 [Protopterus annectens]